MRQKLIATLALLLTSTLSLLAENLPMLRPAHIAVVYDKSGNAQINRYHNLSLQLTDIYTGKEQEIKLKQEATGIFACHFVVYHPIYSVISEGREKKYPVYVEPGDYLVITVNADGSYTYMMHDGTYAKCETLMRHDISNNLEYGEMDFIKDKSQMSFTDYGKKIMETMSDAMLQVSAVANKNNFSDYERNLALSNTKMQMARWFFRFVPLRSDDEGLPKPVKADESDLKSYEFFRNLPLSDSLCLTSPFFPDFIKRYESSYIIGYNQHSYKDSTVAALDADFRSKDLALTRSKQPSLFMDVAILRRRVARDSTLLKVDPRYGEQFVDTTGSIVLREVHVFGNETPEGLKVSDAMQGNAKLQSANPNANLFGFIDLISKHKKKKKRERVKRVLDGLGDNSADEREQIEKAYEETTGKKVDE